MRSAKDISKKIRQAATCIQKGQVVAFPTETVYGLGADALNPMAVAKIFELKQRPAFDPLIVHIASLKDLKALVQDIDVRVLSLAEHFWPGPLTMVLPKRYVVPDIVTAGLSTVGIRMPNNPIALELIRRANCPIAAPSANKFGQISPTNAGHVRKHLPNVDYILDGGKTQVGIESTIITLNDGGFDILRPGAITREEIQAIVPYHGRKPGHKGIIAPGMLRTHYSPNKPIFIAGETAPKWLNRERAGLLSFAGEDTSGYKIVLVLSSTRDLRECAVNLFAFLHKLEESEVDFIVAEPVPEQGIGIAIMDRLKKAAYRYGKA